MWNSRCGVSVKEARKEWHPPKECYIPPKNLLYTMHKLSILYGYNKYIPLIKLVYSINKVSIYHIYQWYIPNIYQVYDIIEVKGFM